MPKKIKSLFEWNVIAISYTTIRILVVFFVLFVLFLSIGIYYYFTREPEEVRQAREKIQNINVQIGNIRKIDRRYYNQNDAAEVAELYQNARRSYNEQEYRESITHSSKAIEILEKMNEEIELRREPQLELYATLTHMKGTVNVRKAGDLEWRRADHNMRIFQGDTIRTLTDSQVLITFEDGSRMQLHPNSYMEIGDLVEDRRTRHKRSRVVLKEPKSKVDFATERSTDLTIQTKGVDTRIVEQRSSGIIDYRDDNIIDVRVYEGRANITGLDKEYAVSERRAAEINTATERVRTMDLPRPVSLFSPIDRKIFSVVRDRLIRTEWIDPGNHQNYVVEISTNHYFTNTLRSTIRNSTKLDLFNIREGSYYWRVYAVNSEGVIGVPSAVFSFIVLGDFEHFDQEKPKLTVNQPQIFGRFVIITGSTDKGAVIFANNERVDVRADGRFQSTIEFNTAGDHQIRIISRNPRNDLETIEILEVTIRI